MGRMTRGGSSAFTYDFGIAIAQSTVSSVTKLAGASLTLAGAFYALQTAGEKYVKTIKTTALAFGGYLHSMKAIEDAQNRINKGMTTFSVDSQIQGIEKLRQSGVNVQQNFELINKGAHAMGVEFSDFAGAISDGIGGNMNKLVEMGLLTQRAARYFQMYPANTIMQQQRVLSFVKQHKGLQSLIKNDFETIQGQMTRIKSMWGDFLRSVVGKPNDPNSLYGQIANSLKTVADAFGRNMEYIKGVAFALSRVLGWVVRQIGKVIMWLGRQSKKLIGETDNVFQKFQERTYAFIVWLEFWKVAVVKFFKDYNKEIKLALQITKFLIEIWAFNKALKWVGLLGKSFTGLGGKMTAPFKLFSRYMKTFGKSFRSFTMAIGYFMPKGVRAFWLGLVKTIAKLELGLTKIIGFFKIISRSGFSKALALSFPTISKFISRVGPFLKNLIPFVTNLVKNLPVLMRSLVGLSRTLFVAFSSSNPIGWILLAIALTIVLYKKFKWFRDFVNSFFAAVMSEIRAVWNTINWLYVMIRAGMIEVWDVIKDIWTAIKNFFKGVFDSVKGWIGEMWSSFKDTTIGKFLNDWLVKPLKTGYDWLVKMIDKLWDFLRLAKDVFAPLKGVFDWWGDKTAESADAVAAKYGFKSASIPSATQGQGKSIGDYVDPSKVKNTAPSISQTLSNFGAFKLGTSTPNSTNATPIPITTQNPIVDNSKKSTPSPATEETQTPLVLGNGSVVINVYNKDINEVELAKKIERILSDMQRGKRVRQGS